MKLLSQLLVIVFVFLFTNIYSQNNLTIKVVNSEKEIVPGAVIFLDKNQQRRVANNKGIYKVKLTKIPKTITAYSPIYGSFSYNYKGENSITIKLPYGDKNNKSQLSLATKNTTYNDVYDFLIDYSKDIKVEKKNISISGINPKFKARTPLLIINGVIVGVETFSKIEPKNIQEVKVLKGAQAARWGLQGSAGVIELKVDTE